MADTVKVDWIYPPDMQDGGWDEKSGNKRVVVRLSCLSDGTGETDVKKVDLSDLKTPSGKIPGKTSIEWIQYQALGMNILLEWDRAPHAEICRINADASVTQGKFDWSKFGGKLDPGDDDGTGDILLTSTGVASGSAYEITMSLRLKD